MITRGYLVALALLGGIAVDAYGLHGSGGFCKWTDSAGVVHYADRCPPDVEGTELATAAGPGDEQLAEAERRAAQLRELRTRQSASQRQEKRLEAEAARAAKQRRLELESACHEAYRNRAILELTLPVYRDELQSLHYHQSLNHHWYTGPRSYLDDQAREEALRHNRQFIDANCKGVPARPEYIFLFRHAPSLTELLYMLRHVDTRGMAPAADVCAHARYRYSELQGASSGFPSDDLREFDQLLRTQCG